MKKLFLLAVVAFGSLTANAGIFNSEDACNPVEEVECYDCAENKGEVLVKLTPCAKKNKPYNYYTWEKTAEKVVSSDKYNWNIPSN